MLGTEILKRDIASFTLEEKFLHKSVYLIGVPYLSLNQEGQNIHKGSLRSILGHETNTVLILKLEVAYYSEYPQKEDTHI